MPTHSGYEKLNKALVKVGDNDLDNWEYLGTTYPKDKYGNLLFETNRKIYTDMDEILKESYEKYKHMKDSIPEGTCICKVPIFHTYFIKHKISDFICQIGSTCVSNWDKEKDFIKQKCYFVIIL